MHIKFAFAKHRCCTSCWRCQRNRHQHPKFLLGSFLILASCNDWQIPLLWRFQVIGEFCRAIKLGPWCSVPWLWQRSGGPGVKVIPARLLSLAHIRSLLPTAKEDESLLAGVTRRSWEGGHNMCFFLKRGNGEVHCYILLHCLHFDNSWHLHVNVLASDSKGGSLCPGAPCHCWSDFVCWTCCTRCRRFRVVGGEGCCREHQQRFV